MLYGWTLAPTVTLVDSGELIVAVHSLGVAHPPGFPLYVVLAHLASLVPIGNVAQRVHFASAVFGAFAAALLTLVTAELVVGHACAQAQSNPKRKKERQPGKLLPSGNPPYITFAPALAAGLLLALSRTLWSYATIAEVYTLNAMLILAVFWLMLKWRRKTVEDDKASGSKGAAVIRGHVWLLYVAASVFGLALGVHHVTVALMLPALALLVWATQTQRFFASPRLFYAATLSFATLIIVYSYLPIAASRAPVINWGNPHTLRAIWAHITGKQYQVFLSFDAKIIGDQLIEFGKLLLREFGPWWLPIAPALAIAGFVQLFRHDRVIFWFLTLMVISDVAYGVSYFIAEDKDAYYLPAFIAIAIAFAFGLRWVLNFSVFRRKNLAILQPILAVLVAIAPAIALCSNWPFNNRRHYFIAHDYVENIFRSMGHDSLLLTLDWQVASPMLYAREIEHLRPDAKVVDVNLLRRSWYFDYLSRAYPEVIERSRDKVDNFVVELKQWENDPEAYARDAKLTQRIASKFQDLIVSFVTKERDIAAVYITNDLVFQTELKDKELTDWLTSRYQFVPRGLIFELREERGFYDPGQLHLETRGLVDGTLKFGPDDVVTLKVLPAYKTMLVNRGRYLNFYSQYKEAAEAFKEALALDSTFELAREGLKDSTAKLPASR